MSTPPKGTSYWVTQIGASALFAIGLPFVSVFLWKEMPNDPGIGLILMLTAIAFFVVLVKLIRDYRSMSKEQRAIYAWAIGQQMAATAGRSTTSDVTAMAMASRAKDGSLRPDELAELRAMRPEVPYPGDTASA